MPESSKICHRVFKIVNKFNIKTTLYVDPSHTKNGKKISNGINNDVV